MAGVSNKPCIMVYYDCDNLSESKFYNVLLGIEEEGIPYELEAVHNSDVLELAHEASVNSRLGVGIGISKEGVVLQFEKLDKASPLFRIKLYKLELYRRIGSNAAILVKKMPFKSLD